MSLVRFKAPGFMCQFAFAFKKSANAWLNLKGRCEGGRGRRAKGGEKQRPKILPDFRGFRLACPTHPTPWQNILGGTWWGQYGHTCTRCHAVPGLWSREGRDIAFCPFGNLAREKLILIQPAAHTGSLFLNVQISFGLPPFWVSQAVLASTFSQTLHFTFGTPTLFGLQSSFGLSLLSSLPPLSRLSAGSWLSSSRRRRRRSKLVATRRCWLTEFLSFLACHARCGCPFQGGGGGAPWVWRLHSGGTSCLQAHF